MGEAFRRQTRRFSAAILGGLQGKTTQYASEKTAQMVRNGYENSFSIPAFPDVGLVAHGGLTAIADDGGTEQLLVLKELVFLLPVHQRVQQRQRLLVLGVGIYQRLPAAQRPGHILELAPAHLFFFQVDHLEFDAALLKIALRLFGIEALGGAEDLDVHGLTLLLILFYCSISAPESLYLRAYFAPARPKLLSTRSA